MNRIAQTFAACRQAGRKALVGYLTVGDPDVGASEARIREALAAGLDVLELGIPFSDPTADGPTIQAAGQRALAAVTTTRDALDLVGRLRRDSDIPIILFGYANPLFRYGYERICADAAGAGADGFLVVDLPHEENGEFVPAARARGLDVIPLVAPTTSQDRVAEIVADATGFVYYIAVRGVTGARSTMPTDLAEHLERVRACTDLPVVVGFGISTGEHAREVARHADGIVVGSALIDAAQDGRLGDLVRELSSALG